MEDIKKSVVNIDDELRVSHQVIAVNTGNEAISIRKLIDKYIHDFKEFGAVSFKMTAVSEEELKKNPDAKPRKIYYLNEQQATFLMTLLRNNKEIVQFKKTLVKAFYDLRTLAEEFYTPRLENRRNFKLPQTEFREIVEHTILTLERENNYTFVELDGYELRETYKNGKIETYKKINFTSRVEK
ncbi:Rha family transcriptional regulator [Sulfurospirillum sp. hDNRA2]|uniref:Rha family transcriptional regulator n=1 Tax=Sulfurospirillum sp. hDNRA2 TaxID=3237298 RepID=UPI0020B80368|nr:Rha family transcriptional regulator [Sulfurospirillum sp. DNRA8]MCP3653225.1 Rha family transcriptional regulator [Sulfurospirillum sp. DNRA8]MCR1812076.1 Rha family transcriptional regulator [Sulfurospirillum sp. DNRA8]